MDFQTPLIFVGIFAVGCILLFFVYKFGIKEKSYEEALAEQRQQTHALLGPKPGAKPKEKKNKKAAKKAKEKVPSGSENVDNHSDEVDATEQQEPQQPHHKKHHVEFKEDTEELAPVKEAPPVKDKKKAKREKARPILVKDKSLENLVAPEAEALPANHFEELHPKDEFELLRSNSSDDLIKPEVSKVVKSAPPAKPVEVVIAKKQVSAPEVPKDDKRQDSAAVTTNGIVANTGKEKKKKKSEFNTLQQLTAGDWTGPNMPILQNLVRKAELSRSEVQILIDLLLNKQHEAPVTVDEWSEGKSDPIQKLKKQLAEKENLLAEEQQALAGAQAKLREIRAEQQSEKSQLLLLVRQSKDDLITKQNEIGRLHQQLQQIQNQLKEEVVKNRAVLDELTSVKMQRQQLETHLTQAKEADAMIMQLQQENLKIRNDAVVQLNTFQAENEQKGELIRQFEEGRLGYEQQMHQQENAFKTEMSHLNEELVRLRQAGKQLQDELIKAKAQKDDGERKIGQLLAELQQLQAEVARLHQNQSNGALEDKAHEIKILNLRNELDLVKNKLQQSETNFEADLKMANGVANSLREELKEQKAKNDALRTRNWKVMEALNAAESRANKAPIDPNLIKSSQDGQREFVERLFPEIKELKTLSSDSFQVESEKYIRRYVEELQEPKESEVSADSTEEIQKLEGQIQHYKNAIDKTEKLLTNLQKHIEQEEINWRVQIAAKTAELEALKSSNSPQLKTRVADLEGELKEEREDKTRILRELQELKSRGGDLAAVEKLSEEVDHLRNQHGDDVSVASKNCNSTNGPSLIQYCISTSSSVASSLGEVTVTNKSKNKKKKKKGQSN